jgi:hypothetical protein
MLALILSVTFGYHPYITFATITLNCHLYLAPTILVMLQCGELTNLQQHPAAVVNGVPLSGSHIVENSFAQTVLPCIDRRQA